MKEVKKGQRKSDSEKAARDEMIEKAAAAQKEKEKKSRGVNVGRKRLRSQFTIRELDDTEKERKPVRELKAEEETLAVKIIREYYPEIRFGQKGSKEGLMKTEYVKNGARKGWFHIVSTRGNRYQISPDGKHFAESDSNNYDFITATE